MKKIINSLINFYINFIHLKKSATVRASYHLNEAKKFSPIIVSSVSSSASINIYKALDSLIDKNIPLNSIIILCIGTDKSTGDSLGPLIGYKLSKSIQDSPLIIGTLESPVHGGNLDSATHYIHNSVCNPYIVAIDACLGSINSIGNIYIERGPLYPGSALNKKLCPVGDVNITAVVNSLTDNPFSTLQNTRLYTVIFISEIICDGIFKFIVSRETNQNSDE